MPFDSHLKIDPYLKLSFFGFLALITDPPLKFINPELRAYKEALFPKITPV